MLSSRDNFSAISTSCLTFVSVYLFHDSSSSRLLFETRSLELFARLLYVSSSSPGIIGFLVTTKPWISCRIRRQETPWTYTRIFIFSEVVYDSIFQRMNGSHRSFLRHSKNRSCCPANPFKLPVLVQFDPVCLKGLLAGCPPTA